MIFFSAEPLTYPFRILTGRERGCSRGRSEARQQGASVSAQLGAPADIACWLAVLVLGGRQVVANGMSPGHLLGGVTSSEAREHLVYVVSSP